MTVLRHCNSSAIRLKNGILIQKKLVPLVLPQVDVFLYEALALHDDMADKETEDKIKRLSTRLAAVAVYNAQTSQDPEFRLKYIYNGIVSDETNLYRFIGKAAGEPFDGVYKKQAIEASPIMHISQDDITPIRLYYTDNNEPIIKGMSRGKMVHNSAYGFILQRKMLDMDLNNCQVIVNKTMDDYCKETVDFLKEVFFK